MKLTLEQQRVIESWIYRKLEHPTCQLCQTNHLAIGELLPDPDRAPGEESSAAMVQVICQNCGHVLLFDVNRIQKWHAVETLPDLM